MSSKPDLVPRTMGTMSKLEIILENDIDEHYHYCPGESLSGTVKVYVQNGDVDMQSLKININGICNVGWQSEGQTLKSQEEYINDTLLLAPLDSKALALDPGVHEFMFSYQLPGRLPSSFIGKYGSVTYVIKASAQDKRQHIISSEPFLVANKQFPWSQEDMLKPITTQVERKFSSGIFRQGKVKVNLSLPRAGYYPGDDVYMTVEVDNQSPRTVLGIQANLMMHTSFTAQTNVHTHIQVLAKRQDNWELVRGEGRRWNNSYITIPMYTPESKLEGCDIIEIKFELLLKIEVKKKAGEEDILISLPLIIGPLSQLTGRSASMKRKQPRTLDRKTLQDMDIAKLLDLQQEEDEFRYKQPVNDGTLRVNPLYNMKNSPSESSNQDTKYQENPIFDKNFSTQSAGADLNGSEESLNQSTRL